MLKHRQKLLILLTAALIVLCPAALAGAMETRSGAMVTVPEGKIHGPLFAAGNDIVVYADVDGDAFIAGQTITINGRINGDLIAAAETVRINGAVTGDVRCAAARVDIQGELGQSITAAAGDVRLREGARVNRDALIFAGNAVLSGPVDRQVLGSGGSVLLDGPVGGDVRLWAADELEIGPAANIAGNLTYGSSRQAVVAPGAKIAGTTKWEQIQPPAKPAPRDHLNWLGLLGQFAAGVLVWGALVLLFPRIWNSLSQNVVESPWPALGWGLLMLLVIPPTAVLLMITVIGIPLSLTLIMTLVILLYAAKIIIGDTIGRMLARRFGWDKRAHNFLPFLAGFALLILLGKIPYIGFFINIVVICMAIGAVFLAVYRWRRQGLNPELTG